MSARVLYPHMKGRPLGKVEAEVLARWRRGESMAAIAVARGVSLSTVQSQIGILQSKLGCSTPEELRTGANV